MPVITEFPQGRPGPGAAAASGAKRRPAAQTQPAAALARRVVGDAHRGVERVERRALPHRVGPVERPGPRQPDLVPPVPAVPPQRGRVGEDEVAVLRARAAQVQLVQVPDEDALELRQVAAAALPAPPSAPEPAPPALPAPGPAPPSAPGPAVPGPGLARLGEDAWRHGQVAQRRRGDGLRLRAIRAIPGDLVQHGKPADDHALVIGPCRAAVVAAGGGQPVVDQAGRADQPAGREPLPLAQRPVQIAAAATGRALMQAARDQQEQLVRYRVLVGPASRPPHPAAAHLVPACRDPREQRTGRLQVFHLAGQVERRDPGQCPPAVVVVKLGAEARVDPLRPGERRLDDVPVPALPGQLAVVDHRGQRVRAVPPASGLPQPRPRLVPALQRGDRLPGPGPERRVPPGPRPPGPPRIPPGARWPGGHRYGVGAPGWLPGCPPLKCSSAIPPVTSVSQRVSELRGSRASVTQAKVSAQVAASTAGTSGDSRLYRYQAIAISNGGHSTLISMFVAAGFAGSKWSPTIWNSRQNDGEITRPDACGSGLSASRP